jgi:hypothetical protein
MLALRRGTVVAAGPPGPMQRLEVRHRDGAVRPALADVALVGPAARGDDVVVNAAAIDLGLGSGGADIVHVNLTRGLAGAGPAGAHVMKLNYTSLQHPVHPVEEGWEESPAASPRECTVPTLAEGSACAPPAAASPRGRTVPTPAEGSVCAPPAAASPPAHVALRAVLRRAPVAVALLHGQLPPLAWAFHQAAPAARLGFVQTAGGALPGALSDVVRALRERGLLAGHLAAAPAFGGADGEAITTAGALVHGVAVLGWDAAVCAPGPGAAVCAPGPGILGSGTRLGHGGLIALESAHTAAALGAQVLIAPRRSGADPRPRHRGLSHHTRTLLELALVPFTVAGAPEPGLDRHAWRDAPADLAGYAASGLPVRTMGRDDPAFFAAALTAGTVLAQIASGR